MAKRGSTRIEIGGGIHSSGDPAKIPAGKSPEIINFIERPGRLEKRRRITEQSVLGDNIFLYRQDARDIVILGGYENAGTYTDAQYLGSGGTWASITGLKGIYDATNANGKFVAAGTGSSSSSVDYIHILSGDPPATFNKSIGGTNVAQYVGGLPIKASTVDYAIRRVVFGSPTFGINNLFRDGAGYDFGNASFWTLSGVTIANAGGVRTATFTSATGSLVSRTETNALAYDQERLLTFHLWSDEATQEVPLTVRITNAAGTVTYGRVEIVLPTKSDQQDWERYLLRAVVPASTNFRVEIQAGTTSKACPVNARVKLGYYVSSDSLDNRGILLMNTADFVPDSTPLSTALGQYSETKEDRFYYTETDSLTKVLATNWTECSEFPGAITAIISGRGYTAVFKQRGMWVYRHTDDPDFPFVLSDHFAQAGCASARSHAFFEGRHYFAGIDRVYTWANGEQPLVISDDGVREEMFA